MASRTRTKSRKTNHSSHSRNDRAVATSLFQKLGGAKAIHAAVKEFYERVLADRQLRHFFADTDMDWLRRSQEAFLTQALGGPARYN